MTELLKLIKDNAHRATIWNLCLGLRNRMILTEREFTILSAIYNK